MAERKRILARNVLRDDGTEVTTFADDEAPSIGRRGRRPAGAAATSAGHTSGWSQLAELAQDAEKLSQALVGTTGSESAVAFPPAVEPTSPPPTSPAPVSQLPAAAIPRSATPPPAPSPGPAPRALSASTAVLRDIVCFGAAALFASNDAGSESGANKQDQVVASSGNGQSKGKLIGQTMTFVLQARSAHYWSGVPT